jgi:hypothetical protein
VNIVDTSDKIRDNELTEYGNYIKPAKE